MKRFRLFACLMLAAVTVSAAIFNAVAVDGEPEEIEETLSGSVSAETEQTAPEEPTVPGEPTDSLPEEVQNAVALAVAAKRAREEVKGSPSEEQRKETLEAIRQEAENAFKRAGKVPTEEEMEAYIKLADSPMGISTRIESVLLGKMPTSQPRLTLERLQQIVEQSPDDLWYWDNFVRGQADYNFASGMYAPVYSTDSSMTKYIIFHRGVYYFEIDPELCTVTECRLLTWANPFPETPLTDDSDSVVKTINGWLFGIWK